MAIVLENTYDARTGAIIGETMHERQGNGKLVSRPAAAKTAVSSTEDDRSSTRNNSKNRNTRHARLQHVTGTNDRDHDYSQLTSGITLPTALAAPVLEGVANTGGGTSKMDERSVTMHPKRTGVSRVRLHMYQEPHDGQSMQA